MPVPHPEPAPVPMPPVYGDVPGPLVESLCVGLPEFVPTVVRLADACGGDPGEPLVLMELADFVWAHLAALEAERSVVERALASVEAHLETMADDRIGCELVAFAFLDSLPPDGRRLLAPRLGPRARALAEELDLPDARWESSP